MTAICFARLCINIFTLLCYIYIILILYMYVCKCRCLFCVLIL